jgi:hypothetical protein
MYSRTTGTPKIVARAVPMRENTAAANPISLKPTEAYRALHATLKFWSRLGCSGVPRIAIKLSWRDNGL